MTQFCLCGDSRGKHENPTKSSSNVGRCLVVREGKPCGCRHYVKDAKKTPWHDYQKMGFMEMIIAGFCSIGLDYFVGFFIEDSINGFGSWHIGGFFAGLIVMVYWYYEYGKKWFAKFKAECLE